ncbi:MAG: PRC-barrel domain-containing protein [Actinobacteria bacterium]|nr:PRC-barrel domain-containing protein [Actinomycetota bacterium]
MRKSKQFLNMNVVSLEEGRQIGSLGGLVIDPASKNVAALIVEQKGWFREQKFIPYSRVHNIGEDVVTIDRSSRVEKGASLPQILKLFKDRVNITGSRLVTESGTVLGVVEEFYVDLKTGDVVGLEFSGGTVNNLFRGSAFLDINYIRTLGTRIVICHDSALDKVVKMEGGIQESLRSFRENTGQLLGTTLQKTRVLGRSLNQSLEKIKRDRPVAEKKDTPKESSPGGEQNCSGNTVEEQMTQTPFADRDPSLPSDPVESFPTEMVNSEINNPDLSAEAPKN